jgi:hypothetical protein
MKMDGCQNKGVAGGAFCNDLKRKGMDGGKSRRSNRVTVEKNGGRGVPYPGYFAKCAEALEFTRVGGNTCLKVWGKSAEREGSKGVKVNRGCKAGRMRGGLAGLESNPSRLRVNFHNK